MSLNSDFEIKRPFKSNLRNSQYVDLHYFKLPRSLRYADRATMRYSIETRLPFLDHKLVEKCIQMSSKFKFINQQQRFLFKKYIKNKLKIINLKIKDQLLILNNFGLRENLKSTFRIT